MRARGFTLIELFMVLAIISISAAVIVPATMGSNAHHRVRSSARILLAHAQHARSEAVSKGQLVRFTLELDAVDDEGFPTGRFWSEVEADPFGAPDEMSPAAGPFGQHTPLGETVRFVRIYRGATPGRQLDAEAEELTDGLTEIEFRADGTCHSAAIVLGAGDEDAEQIALRIEGVTGRVRVLSIEELEAELAVEMGQ